MGGEEDPNVEAELGNDDISDVDTADEDESKVEEDEVLFVVEFVESVSVRVNFPDW